MMVNIKTLTEPLAPCLDSFVTGIVDEVFDGILDYLGKWIKVGRIPWGVEKNRFFFGDRGDLCKHRASFFYISRGSTLGIIPVLLKLKFGDAVQRLSPSSELAPLWIIWIYLGRGM